MTDKKEVEKKLSRFATAEKPKVSLKTSTGGVQYVEFEKALRSINGLTQEQAGVMLYGSVDNYKTLDPSGSQTRGKIRKAWRAGINPEKELSIAHTKSDNGQTYFIIAKSEFREWSDNFGMFGVKIDDSKQARNSFDAKELGLE